MTTLRTILTRAMRMTRARPVGDDPDGPEMTAALEEAQSMFLVFPIRRLTDVLITTDYTAEENERITWTSGSPTVTFPTTITEDGTDRTPYNGAIVETSGTSGSTRKIYITELKTWMTLTSLTLDTEQPFGPTHDGDVAAMIAARIAGTVLQTEAPQDVLALANAARTNIRNAFWQKYTPTFDRALLRPEDLNMET
jgi:hypothetical protein